MQFDRNSVIGFLLLALLFFGFFYFTRQGQLESERKKKAIEDSIARLKPPVDSLALRLDSLRRDTANRVQSAGGFTQAALGQEQLTVVENEVLRITFTNKGGQPKSVQLKNYRSFDSSEVKLVDAGQDYISYAINTAPNQTAQIRNLFFNTPEVRKQADGSQQVKYALQDSLGKAVEHVFTVKPGEYMIDWTIQLNGSGQLLSQSTLNLQWRTIARRQELDMEGEKRETQIGLAQDGDFDYFTMGSGLSKEFEEGLQWLSVKQKFFNTTIVGSKPFSYAGIESTVPPDSTGVIAESVATLKMPVEAASSVSVPLRVYYGPNDYKTLKTYGNEMESLVNLGQGFYAFVKYINRWMVVPVFNFFAKFVSSYGLVIALLTIFIRLLTSPLVYSSYLSGAKMKALRPEIEKLKEKLGDDQQAMSLEQMKLFRSAGVNPLGGCIPALLQIPIFFALYSFFNSSIALRGEKFWWANDLSSYDAIFHFGFKIPFLGDHISLFTLLAVGTSLLISIYSMSMSPDQSNPVLKYMPYIFPIFLLGIFNSLPSALTWYYTVSNVITLALQFVIQNYIINHDKILAQIEENRKKPKGKPKWQERLEQMQQSQAKLQEMQKKKK